MGKKESLMKVLVVALKDVVSTHNMAIPLTDLSYINETVKEHGVFAVQNDYDHVFNKSILVINMGKLFKDTVFTDEAIKELHQLARTAFTECPALSPVSIDMDTSVLSINAARFGKRDINVSVAKFPEEVVLAIRDITKYCEGPNADVLSTFLMTLMRWIGHPVVFGTNWGTRDDGSIVILDQPYCYR